MKISEFLSSLFQQGITVQVEQENLKISCSKGVLSPEIQDQLRERKVEIIAFINAEQAASDRNFPMRRVDRSQPIPVSYGQQALWLQYQLEGPSNTYNIPVVYRLEGELDITALEKSLRYLITRHDALRTSFKSIEGEPYQVIAETVEWNLDVYTSDRETAERELLALAGQPFSLEQAPLMRAFLWKHSQNKYTLLFNIHHIIFDGWSQRVFEQELAQVYYQYAAGMNASLPELELDYVDYALWQSGWLKGEELNRCLAYWKENLKGAPELLELPTDHRRPPVRTYRGRKASLDIGPALVDRLQELERREGVTLFMLLNAAYAVLLGRYSCQEDVVIGFPVANRPRRELQGMLGVFLNMLPLRVNLSGNPGVSELLQRVRHGSLDAYDHQDAPFEKMVTELHARHDSQFSPIFQVALVLENVPQNLRLGECIALMDNVNIGVAKYDLLLFVQEESGVLHLELEYNTDLFELDKIERMLVHFKRILEWIVSSPTKGICEFDLLSETECHQILLEWNNTAADYPREKCIHQIIEEQVERSPDSPAVLFGERQLTYRELNERANKIAHYLRKLGAVPGIPVGLYLERSANLVVGILGILKSGSPYVPLDTIYPLERRAGIIRDSGMKIIVTQDALVTDEFGSDLSLLRLDGQHEFLEAESNHNPVHVIKPENLVYIIYTSGSTGKPKGVEISHRSVVNCLLSANERIGLSAGNLSIAVFTPAFDVSVFDLLGPLCLGATVVVASREEVFDSVLLAKRIMELPVTWMSAAPTTWRMLLETGWQGKAGLKIISTGEALPSDLANRLTEIAEEVYNMYGPTEATIWCASVCLSPGQPVTIGRPIANTSLYILDPHHRPVPVGVVGELYIGGEGLARGYHNLPELTAEKFIPDPFNCEPGGRLYATGDLARYRENGEIDVLGRIDNQVKIRGFRIEVGEIEAAIGQYQGIRQALVVVREDQPGEKRLVAYIVPTTDLTLDADELRSFLKVKLPSYMLPSAFVQLEAFPLTINGKIDRKALPATDQNNLAGNRCVALPRDALEQKLVEIWEKLLNIQPVGIDDNFFELGGHSLLAVRLFTQIEGITGRKLPLVTLFQSPTINSLATIIRAGNQFKTGSSLVSIKPEGSKPPFFMVPGLGGGVIGFYDLAKYLDPDQPFYGLQAKGFDGGSSPLCSVEEMAAHYIKEMCACFPEGPYLLGGHSLGGRIAVEMAIQLQNKGRCVALVALLDTQPNIRRFGNWYQRIFLSVSHLAGDFLERVTYHAQNILSSTPKAMLSYLQKFFMNQIEKINFRKSVVLNSDQNTNDHKLPEHIQILRQAMRIADRNYMLKKYPDKLTLFRAEEQVVGLSGKEKYDRQYGWQNYAEDVDVYIVPGDHNTLLKEPNVKVLARTIQDCIDRVLADK